MSIPMPTSTSSTDSTALRERVRAMQLPPNVVPGSPFGRLLPWLLCLVLGAGCAVLGMLYASARSAAASASTSAADTAPTPLPSQDQGQGGIVLENKGYIVPAHQILVSPKVSGAVVELNIEEGMTITDPEFIIARLEDTEYRAEYNRVKASLEMAEHRLAELSDSWPKEIGQAKAELAEAMQNLAPLEQDFKRNLDLYQGKLVTRQELEQSESLYNAQKQRIERLKLGVELLESGPREKRIRAAEAEVAQIQAELVKAKWKLDNCVIKTPILGTILKKNAERGNIVNPVAFNGSFSLCEMADLHDLEVDLSVQEVDIAKVFPGQRCEVRADAFPDRRYEGVVSRLMPIADRAKGSISVRVKVIMPANERQAEYLKPEMVVNVTFYGKEGPPAKSGE